MGVSERAAEQDLLQIGDTFALECLPPGEQGEGGGGHTVGFVAARPSSHSCFVDFVHVGTEARIDSQCGSGRPPNPELSRFALCTPNQYIAAKTLRVFEQFSGGNFAEGEQLKMAAEKESSSNAAVMRSSRGKVALFGDVFQLQVRTFQQHSLCPRMRRTQPYGSPAYLSGSQHPAGYFLDLNKQMAVEEPAALRCGLALPHERTKHTWFRFLPGFRTRKEGEPIRMGDTIIIQSMKKSSKLNVHVGRDDNNASGTPTPASEFKSRSELNLYTAQGDTDADSSRNSWRTRFRVVPVAKFNAVEKSKGDVMVRGGDYVEVFHRQSQGYLTVDHRHHKRRCRLFRPIPDSKEADPVSTVASELVWKLITPAMAWSGANVTIGARDDNMSSQALCLNAASECGADLFLAEGEDGSLDLVLNADDPAAQWHLQPFDSADGAVRYDSTKFYLVNAETGNILQQGKELDDKDPAAGEGHAWFRLTAMSATIEHESDAFVFHSLGSSRPADMTSDLTGSSDTRRANGWLAAFQAAEEGLDGLCEFHAEIEGILAMDRTDAQARAVTTPPATPTSVEKKPRRRRKRRGALEASAQHLEDQLKAMPHPNLHLGLTLNRDHLPPPPKVRRLLAAAACLLATPAGQLLCPSCSCSCAVRVNRLLLRVGPGRTLEQRRRGSRACWPTTSVHQQTTGMIGQVQFRTTCASSSEM